MNLIPPIEPAGVIPLIEPASVILYALPPWASVLTTSLDAGFDVRDGSTLTVNGDDNSSFNVSAGTIEGGRVVVNAPLGGTITLTNGAVFPFGAPDGGTLELGGGASADTTVAIRTGTLQLDQPMAFLGQVDLVHRFDPVSFKPLSDASSDLPFAPQRVDLVGLVADAFSFDDASHTLSLFNGDQQVDQLRFTPDVTSADFQPSVTAAGVAHPAGFYVLQQSSGVSVLGLGGVPTGPLPESSPLTMRMA